MPSAGSASCGIVSKRGLARREKIEPDNLEAAREIVEVTGADYPHIVLTESGNNLFVADVFRAAHDNSFWTAKANRVGKTYLGARSYDEWAEIIEDLLEEAG